MMWNLSKMIRALGALFVTELRNGFHMSMAASSMCALFFAQRLEKQVDVGFFAPLAADPDGAFAIQVADDDAVVVPLADRDLVDTDGPGCRQSRPLNLLCM